MSSVWIAILVLWSLVWKGLALWHSARRDEVGWYVVLLVVNTAGILEIIYLLLVRRIPFAQLFSRGPRHLPPQYGPGA